MVFFFVEFTNTHARTLTQRALKRIGMMIKYRISKTSKKKKKKKTPVFQ